LHNLFHFAKKKKRGGVKCKKEKSVRKKLGKWVQDIAWNYEKTGNTDKASKWVNFISKEGKEGKERFKDTKVRESTKKW